MHAWGGKIRRYEHNKETKCKEARASHGCARVIKIKKASSSKGSEISHACRSTFPPPNQKSFSSQDSMEAKLESMYLNICLDISSLANLVCRNRLGCLGYKYITPSIVKGLSHNQSTNSTFFLQFTSLSAASLFFSVSSFELIKDASHSSRM